MESSSEAFFEGRRDHMNARLEWGVQARLKYHTCSVYHTNQTESAHGMFYLQAIFAHVDRRVVISS